MHTYPHKNPVSRLQRNHALEHATLQILSKKNPSRPIGGISGPGGFWVIGNTGTEELCEAVNEAISRLHSGQSSLAIHPYCGTNFAIAGLLAGIAAWLGMLGVGKTWRQKLDRLPLVVTLVTLVMILAQPLGPLLQAKLTTRADLNGLKGVEVLRIPNNALPIHRVLTKYS